MVAMRIQSVISIAMMTGFLCFQDYIKKSIVLANFTQSALASEKSNDGIPKTKIKNRIQNKVNKAKQIYGQAKSSAKQSINDLKQKGQGSYYVGIKKTLKQRQQRNKQDQLNKYDINNEPQTESSSNKTTLAKYSDLAIQLYTKSIEMKKNLVNKFQDKIQLYNIHAQSKSQDLVNKHYKFGVMTALGSFFMPQTYMTIALLYFLSYQIYFFSGNIGTNQKFTWIKDIQFTPIWYFFMITSGSIISLKLIKKLRAFAK